jgi:phage tail-like protein
LQLEGHRAGGGLEGAVPVVARDEKAVHIIWEMEHTGPEPARYEFEVSARVEPALEDVTLESRGVLSLELEDGSPVYLEESASLLVQAQGRYLKYLPSIYQDDELMGRFLMLFESFLAPVEKKISGQAEYLDPRLAPDVFLPWLASWTDLELDDSLDEQSRRSLVSKSASLMRQRGTRAGLQEYLEAFTTGQVDIIEHASENFVLGSDALLGPGIALGTDNVPNTFSVYLSLPDLPASLAEEERSLRKRALERKIHDIIENEKPVHTGYTLHLAFEPLETRIG